MDLYRRGCVALLRVFGQILSFLFRQKKSISGVFTDIANARSHRTILLFQQSQCL